MMAWVVARPIEDYEATADRTHLWTDDTNTRGSGIRSTRLRPDRGGHQRGSTVAVGDARECGPWPRTTNGQT